MMGEMLCGLIIGNEFTLYTGTELIGILCGSLVAFVGILILTFKKSQVQLFDEDITAVEGASDEGAEDEQMIMK